MILNSVKNKRVKESAIRFAVEGIFKIIKNGKFKKPEIKTNSNPIVELRELVQRQFGSNIETRVTNKRGADHCPIIDVEIVLPNGISFEASGWNKKGAKQLAAMNALEFLTNMNLEVFECYI